LFSSQAFDGRRSHVNIHAGSFYAIPKNVVREAICRAKSRARLLTATLRHHKLKAARSLRAKELYKISSCSRQRRSRPEAMGCHRVMFTRKQGLNKKAAAAQMSGCVKPAKAA
jgi:hypothetical protein